MRNETFFITAKSVFIQLLHTVEFSGRFKQPYFVPTERLRYWRPYFQHIQQLGGGGVLFSDNKTWQIGCSWFQRNKWSVIFYHSCRTCSFFQQEIFAFITTILLYFTVLYPRAHLTITLLTWRIWWTPTIASKWQVGFNSAFKGLSIIVTGYAYCKRQNF